MRGPEGANYSPIGIIWCQLFVKLASLRPEPKRYTRVEQNLNMGSPANKNNWDRVNFICKYYHRIDCSYSRWLKKKYLAPLQHIYCRNNDPPSKPRIIWAQSALEYPHLPAFTKISGIWTTNISKSVCLPVEIGNNHSNHHKCIPFPQLVHYEKWNIPWHIEIRLRLVVKFKRNRHKFDLGF